MPIIKTLPLPRIASNRYADDEQQKQETWKVSIIRSSTGGPLYKGKDFETNYGLFNDLEKTTCILMMFPGFKYNDLYTYYWRYFSTEKVKNL
jgi:hypothetical protein